MSEEMIWQRKHQDASRWRHLVRKEFFELFLVNLDLIMISHIISQSILFRGRKFKKSNNLVNSSSYFSQMVCCKLERCIYSVDEPYTKMAMPLNIKIVFLQLHLSFFRTCSLLRHSTDFSFLGGQVQLSEQKKAIPLLDFLPQCSCWHQC